ncbi:MAG TPA: ATP-binding protein [Acetobacteraceae bacterium]|nr:ATP-binding protein [Acetobacteraceae bacterium]HTC11672.1 ATP-binding protein [Acetobacteraceae bacterium]
MLPRSLLARSLLMILLPLLILEGVALQIFYGGHIDLVSRRMSGAVAGELAFTISMMQRYPDLEDVDWILARARDAFGFDIALRPGAQLVTTQSVNVLGPMDDDLKASLEETLHLPFFMDWTSDPRFVLVQIQLHRGILEVEAPRKRLYITTFYLFVLWMVGSAVLVFTIAALFMRNQVRAIRRLAGAAEAFGMGRDPGPIKPEGALEVRQAATAFNRMQERIRRYLQQRTEMLAGVSHDLRTPLTRMRLTLAMLPKMPELRDDVAEMTADVADMERMIGAYLAFARGEGVEQVEPVDLAALLESVAARARRSGADVATNLPPELTLPLRADATRRAITNLIDNARRYARHVVVAAAPQGTSSVLVTVDDDGPGIPPAQRETVFRPFETGASDGTGLGLTIARDIVRAHGGDIVLEDSPLGGLRARIRLPA